ncbi:uncharacterized protein N0V96_005104 [Colletotrichum fioriniae]|uniref:uncharacterized protein n=1 Tax=Colletotrichum fioriniae TaxID=710243 RepID=UPI0032D9E588|nr:hypothetical protein N0V96_005104 [Colletotrichum fioriniae]
MVSRSILALCLAATVYGHGDHDDHQKSMSGPHQSLWYNTIPGDGGTQADSVFSGISTFGRLPYQPCLGAKNVKYDIAFIGSGGYNVPLATNPFNSWATVLDCGDIPVTSYDNTWALHQIEEGHFEILSRQPATDAAKKGPAKNERTLPRVITLGGDHTITLPLLRSINQVASINHGTYFYHAAQEGLLRNDSNIHAGIRTTLSGPSDYENDGYCGFEIVEAREIDKIGTDGIIKKIIDRVGTKNPVYLSLDIDTLDPAFAPATGTPETGGWSTRELRTILRGLEDLNLIAADIVEVAPAYDTNAEHTTMAAADALYEIMSIMVKRGPLSAMVNQTEVYEEL